MDLWKSANGVYLIAEIGGNHEGDFEGSRRLTELACSSGVDAVKFQIYTGDSLVNRVEDPDRNAHFKRFELTKDQYLELSAICEEHDVDFMASVWDPAAVDWIDDKVSCYKIGSGDLTAYPVLKKIADKRKPMILSTGLSTMDEISGTLRYLQGLDPIYGQNGMLALLQCTSMYPIPHEEANLNVMGTLKKKFGVVVGYSDHTVGTDAVLAASALGAEIIEFHFTDSREGKVFRDHKISFTRDEVKVLLPVIKKMRTLAGAKDKAPTASEISSGHVTSFRRALYPARDLAGGTVLKEEDLVALRPNVGIGAEYYEKLLGRTLKKDLKALEKLSWEFFD